MTDLDILVKQEDAIRMRKILLKNGYESAPLISHVFEKKIFRHGKHLPEMYKKGLSVEIHFKLFGAQEKRIGEEFINKSYQISEESKALYPDQQLHFLYLVKHLDKHEKEGTSQLRLYADLVVLLQNYFDRIVCRELFEYASEAGLEGAIAEKFIILEEYLGISFQEWITSFTGKTNSDAIKEKFIRFLRHPADNQPRAEKGSLFNPVKEIHGLFNKSLFITGFLFPSLAYLKYNYKVKSKTIAALYYPVWWVRLGRMLIKGRV